MSKVEEFALANPISLICDKEKNEFTREDFIKVIIKNGIERITFHYTALDGKVKELKIPVSNRNYAELLLTEGERVDGSSLFKGVVDPGKSDLYVVPQYKTAFINPFDNKSMDFVCRFFDKDGNLASFPPDNVLANAAGLIRRSSGLDLHALGELEFFLIGNFINNTYPMPRQKGYHAGEPFVKGGVILNEMLSQLSRITGNIKYAHNEVGYIENISSDCAELNGKSAEQVEVEFLPTPIEETADILVLARWIIRNVAYRNGFVATFTPKLEVGHAGSGMHVHMALMKDGRNMMADDGGVLTQEAKANIGGLCRYARSLTAFGNTIAGSYLRLVPHQEAPTKICWSELNRSALIRVPLGWGNINNLASRINPQQKQARTGEIGRQTVELRSPDGSCNTHLLLAGIAMAAEWGLSNRKESLELAERCYAPLNIHDSATVNELEELPESCFDSSVKLLEDRKLYEREDIFSGTLIDYVAASLAAEDDKTLNQRLMGLPEEEKQAESRKVMHRDIHKH